MLRLSWNLSVDPQRTAALEREGAALRVEAEGHDARLAERHACLEALKTEVLP